MPMPSYAALVNAPTPSSKPGASCANSAAAPGKPGSSPKPSTSFKGTVQRTVFPARHAGLRSGGMGTVSDGIGCYESAQEGHE